MKLCSIGKSLEIFRFHLDLCWMHGSKDNSSDERATFPKNTSFRTPKANTLEKNLQLKFHFEKKTVKGTDFYSISATAIAS